MTTIAPGISGSVSARRTGRTGRSGHVVTVLPRGEAIRNFVYSGMIDELSAECDVTALSVWPSEEIWSLIAAQCRSIELGDYPEHRIVNTLREVLDIAHGRRLWSEAAQDRWQIRDHESRVSGAVLKRTLKKAVTYPFANQPGLRALSALERTLSRALQSTDVYTELYRQLRPSLVFNGSHVHSPNAIQAVQAAQWLGIPTAAFIFSWDNLTSQGRILPAYDYYLVWNRHMADALVDIYPGIPPERVIVTGTPQFDFHFRPKYQMTRADLCARIGANPSRRMILYSTGMANHMPGEERIIEHIADLSKEHPDLDRPQLVVRVYAKDQTGRFDELKRRRRDILFPEVPWESAYLTPKPADLELLTNLLLHCDAGINVASTISLELCMFDKPVINIGFDPPGMDIRPVSFARYYSFDHYAPVVRSGAVEVAYSGADLGPLLANALKTPGRRKEERRKLIAHMFADTLDGKSSSRVAQALKGIAAAHAK